MAGNTLVLGRYARVVLTHDHVLLWEYNQPQILATFYGRVQDPLAVVGALFERHIDLAGTWIPFLKYLNPCIRLPELISGSFGMLAEGPETLVLAYEQVMSDYGVSVSHHQSAPEHFEMLSVLILDEAYVIGNAFFAEPT